MRPKLCYVIPSYRPDDATHLPHLYDFLKEISKSFDLYLIIEKGTTPPVSLGYTKSYVVKSSFFLFKRIETKIALLRARFLGYNDFYIHYSFFAAFAASFIVKIFGGRVFYWNCGEPWKYRRNFLKESFERITYKSVTFVVTGAPSLAHKYAEIYNIPLAKIKIMPNWIDLKRFVSTGEKTEARRSLNIPDDSKVVLFVHRLSPRKGSRMIMPVAKEVIRAIPNVFFLVAGGGPDEDFLRNGIKSSGLGGSIRLLGAISNRDLPGYFSASDVFFMPSEEEGFPRVILESMALGVPFVASDVGAVKDIAPDSMKQYVLRSGDVKSFAEKLVGSITKNSDEQKMISNGLKKEAAKYDVSIVAKRFHELFS